MWARPHHTIYVSRRHSNSLGVPGIRQSTSTIHPKILRLHGFVSPSKPHSGNPTLTLFAAIAPEYALDEQISPASDLYSLGCVIYAVHAHGDPPLRNRGNLGTMRSNVGRLEGGGGLRGMDNWDQDLRCKHPTLNLTTLFNPIL